VLSAYFTLTVLAADGFGQNLFARERLNGVQYLGCSFRGARSPSNEIGGSMAMRLMSCMIDSASCRGARRMLVISAAALDADSLDHEICT